MRGDLSPFRERVLPNACVELMVNLGPRHFLHTQRGTSTWDHAWLSGLHEQALVIESPSGTHLVSARLHPLGARDLLGTRRARECQPCRRSPRGLCGGGRAPSSAARRRLARGPIRAARAVSSRAEYRARDAQFVREAVQRIDAAHGNLRISALHAELGVSRKHLAVSFAREVGISRQGLRPGAPVRLDRRPAAGSEIGGLEPARERRRLLRPVAPRA